MRKGGRPVGNHYCRWARGFSRNFLELSRLKYVMRKAPRRSYSKAVLEEAVRSRCLIYLAGRADDPPFLGESVLSKVARSWRRKDIRWWCSGGGEADEMERRGRDHRTSYLYMMTSNASGANPPGMRGEIGQRQLRNDPLAQEE